jgi:hypothetical protein
MGSSSSTAITSCRKARSFFLAVAYDLAGTAVFVFTLIGIVLVPAVAASLIGKRRVLPLLERFSAWRELRLSTQAPRIARGLFYGVLFAMLICLPATACIPSTRRCAFRTCFTARWQQRVRFQPGTESVVVATEGRIAVGGLGQAGEFFGERLTQAIYFILLAAVAWTTVAPWRRRGWLILPFIVSMGCFLMLLTMDYAS